MSEEIDNLLGINVPSSERQSRSENNEGRIQKHTTGWVFLGWLLIIVSLFFLWSGFRSYHNDSIGMTDTVNGIRERVQIASREAAISSGYSARDHVRRDGEGLIPSLIGGALMIAGICVARASSVLRCSDCGGRVAIATARICPSCGTEFVARR